MLYTKLFRSIFALFVISAVSGGAALADKKADAEAAKKAAAVAKAKAEETKKAALAAMKKAAEKAKADADAAKAKGGRRAHDTAPKGQETSTAPEGSKCPTEKELAEKELKEQWVGNCKAGFVQYGAFCYEPCKPGFKVSKTLGHLCTKPCPPGFEDSGLHCYKPQGYDRTNRDRAKCNAETFKKWGMTEKEYNSNPKHGMPCEHKKGEAFFYSLCPSGFKTVVTRCEARCPEFTTDIGVSCQKDKGFHYVRKMDESKWGKQAGEIFKAVGCALSGGVPCLMEHTIKMIMMFADAKKRDAFFCRLEANIRTFVTSFTGVLDLKELSAKELGKQLGTFFKTTMGAVEGLLAAFSPPVTNIKAIDDHIHKPAAAAISAILIPNAVVMGITHFGVKKLMGWLIPELIFATGDLKGQIDAKVKEHGEDGQALMKMIFDVVKVVAGTAINVMGNMGTPEKKERMKASIEKALKITEKIKEATDKAVGIAMASARGEKVDKAAAENLVDVRLVEDNPEIVVNALAPIVTDEVWLAIAPTLTKLVGKLSGVIKMALNIPIKAVTGAVGSVPFVGGVLSALLGFGLDLVVDYVLNIVTDQLMAIAEKMVKDVLEEVFDSLKAKMTGKSPKSQKNKKYFATFLGFAQEMLGEITGFLKTTAAGMNNNLMQSIAGGVAGLATAIVPQIMKALRLPVAEQKMVGSVLGRAGDVAIALLEKPMVPKNVVASIVNTAAPIGEYLLGMIPDAGLKKMLLHAHAGIVEALQDVDSIAKSPGRLLAGLGETVGSYVKELLDKALAHKSVAPERGLIADAIDEIIEMLKDPVAYFEAIKAKGTAGIVAKIADLAGPYAAARLRALVEGTGLESLVELAVRALFDENGPIRNGEKFFAGLQKLFSEKGTAMLGDVISSLSSFVSRQIARVAGSQVPASVIEGFFKGIGNALQAPGGFGALAKGGVASVLKMVGEALSALLDAVVGATGSADSGLALLRSVGNSLLSLLKNAEAVTLVPGAVLRDLAGALAKALRELVKNAVASLSIDAGLKPFIGGLVEGVFDLLADPTQLARLKGSQALAALQKGAALILPYLKDKLSAALPDVAKELVGALVTDLQQVLGSSDGVAGLAKGSATDYVARAVRVVGPTLVKLIVQAIPSSAQSAVRTVLETIQKGLGDAAALAKLGSMNVDAIGKALVAYAKPLLQSLVSTVTGVDTSAVAAAFSAIESALANPAATAKQLLQKAVEAIDQKLLPLLVRIENAALRDVATGVVSIVRELVDGGGAGALKANAAALWKKIASTASRFATSLVQSVMPSPELRELVASGIRGLEELFSQPNGFSGAAAKVGALIASAAEHLGRVLLAAVRDRLDPAVSTLLTGVVRTGLELVADPARWQAIAKDGVAALLSSFVPAVENFVLAAIAKASKIPGTLRAFIETTVRSVAGLLGDSAKRAAFIAKPETALARAGIDALKSFIQGEVSRSATGAKFSGLIGKAFDAVADLLTSESARAKVAAFSPGAFFAMLADEARPVVASLLEAAIPDKDLRALAVGSISTVTAKVADLIKRPAEVVAILKETLTQAAEKAKGLIPVFMTFVKAKLAEALKKAGAAPELADFVLSAIGGLERFGSAMMSDATAWKKHAGDSGKEVMRSVLGWLFSLAKKRVEKQIGHAGAQKLVLGLIDGTVEILADPVAMVDAIKKAVSQGAEPVLNITLPKIAPALDGFLKTELVARMPKGVVAELMNIIVGEITALLKKPVDLVAIIKELMANQGDKIKARLMGLVNRLIGAFAADKNTKGFVGPMQAAVKMFAK
ncbi:MAG: hypothetical protein HYY84_13385 [Deltaproteobacteria bacterium]|nr:hypothetical protein [Deltaproteobacteria bacterium]